MRALRVVGILENDGEFSVVLEDTEHRERFTVPADEKLRAAARGDLTRLGQIAVEVESQLRPREIQARIRAGASVEQVAAMAGVPLQKIERFAYPVLLERSRTAEVAQRAHPVRANGPDPRELGDVVANTFGMRGQEYTGGEWDSWKGEDGKWVVVLSWHAGHSDIRAHWTYQPGANGGTVTALDENAGDLIEGNPARPLRPVGPVIDMARPDDYGPAPAPLPELRAAASAGDRRGPDPGYTGRTAPEPRRPVPPAQRGSGEPRYTPEPAGHPAERQASAYSTPPTTYAPPPERQAPAYPAPPERRGAERPATPGAGREPVQPREPIAAREQAAPREQTAPREPSVRESERVEAERSAPVEVPVEDAVDEAVVETPVEAAADEAPVGDVVEEVAAAEPASAEAAVAEPAAPEPAVAKPATEEPAPTEPTAAAETPEEEPAAPVEAAPAADPRPAEPEVAAAPAEQEAPEAAAAKPEPATAEEPAAPETPAPAKPAAARRTKKGKPVMPSWDEVLLGVRGPR